MNEIFRLLEKAINNLKDKFIILEEFWYLIRYKNICLDNNINNIEILKKLIFILEDKGKIYINENEEIFLIEN